MLVISGVGKVSYVWCRFTLLYRGRYGWLFWMSGMLVMLVVGNIGYVGYR